MAEKGNGDNPGIHPHITHIDERKLFSFSNAFTNDTAMKNGDGRTLFEQDFCFRPSFTLDRCFPVHCSNETREASPEGSVDAAYRKCFPVNTNRDEGIF